MTTSFSNAVAVHDPADQKPVRQIAQPVFRRPHTLASRMAFLMICLAIVLTTLAYGTVHYWALAVFAVSAASLVAFWVLDAAVLRAALVPVNPLQWPILALVVLGLLQLLPLRSPDDAGLSLSPVRSLSLDPYSTRLVIVQVTALLFYFVATTVFLDTPRRLKALVRAIVIFGFILAAFGLTQSFTTDGTRVYWFRQLTQSQAFGPFINRHHFAGYMELALAMPLGLLVSGALESYKRPLYAFAVVVMAMSLVATNSRGGIISLGAEIFFVLVVAGFSWRRKKEQSRAQRMRSAVLRAAAAVGIVLVLIGGALLISGPEVFTRFLGTPVADDPTQGRAHFWNVTLDVIKSHPMLGSGLGSFSVIYTRYDTRNGAFRLEQAHNDYLQTLSDAGILGAVLGVAFIVILFRRGFARRETHDKFRRGVNTGALAGCFAVLIHSFFDFTLHTTANALLFIIICAIATQDTRINTTYDLRARGGRRRRKSSETEPAESVPVPATDSVPVVDVAAIP
ncbi:MAG TPA: O-antigen ligase family protein [Pyrinomonadaceae bacterium]|nr:O-antigen ligase family protein [Pyrinomonadaceae bacterium]